MKRRLIDIILFLFFLILGNVYVSEKIVQNGTALALSGLELQSDEFRQQQLSEGMLPYIWELQEKNGLPTGEIMTVLAARGNTWKNSAMTSRSPEYFAKWKQILMKYDPLGFARVNSAYSAIWNDILCFPVAEGQISYENSWMFERTYGGVRGHEGTDLMPPENLPGFYRIVSMTDGVVEKIGWLPKGGYRIGIRSPSGGYFYYAHLENYSRKFYIGETVEAGTVLGTMGDSGYGPEGTRGRFPVHLHLGIYIAAGDEPELSVNPYWVLRYLQYCIAH